MCTLYHHHLSLPPMADPPFAGSHPTCTQGSSFSTNTLNHTLRYNSVIIKCFTSVFQPLLNHPCQSYKWWTVDICYNCRNLGQKKPLAVRMNLLAKGRSYQLFDYWLWLPPQNWKDLYLMRKWIKTSDYSSTVSPSSGVFFVRGIYFTNATAKKSEFHILLILDSNLVVVLCGVLLLLPLFDNGLYCRPHAAATARTHFSLSTF